MTKACESSPEQSPARCPGILSDKSLLATTPIGIRQNLTAQNELDEIIKKIEAFNWSYENLIIHPFNNADLSPYSYDLRMGDWVWSLFDRATTQLSAAQEYRFEPGNTIVVLTHEYFVFPKNISGRVSPRFSFVYNGILQSMVKIDPTWYGKLAICLTNQSNRPYALKQGEPFCTLVLEQLSEPSDQTCLLRERNRKSTGICVVGQTDLKHFQDRAVAPQEYNLPQVATQEDLIKECKKLGPPFGIMTKIPEITVALCRETFIAKEAIIAHKTDVVKALTELEKGLYPNVTRITLSVIGYLSMILAVMGVVMKAIQLKDVQQLDGNLTWISLGFLAGFGLASLFYLLVTHRQALSIEEIKKIFKGDS